MSKPTTKPAWIPDDNPAKITAPDGTKQAAGWLSAEKPAFQYFNWFWNLVSKWIAYFETITDQVPVANGGTGATSASAARTNLGLGSIATQASSSVSISGGTISGITDIAVADGGTGASTSSAARTNLGLGSIATQASSSVSISGGTISGITDIAVADGGTGASTSSAARTNLGLGSIATQASSAVSITGGSVTGITDITVADGGTGASDATSARTNLGLGSIATQASSAVSITGGSVTGITDIAVADGGTGASNASGALTNLGLTGALLGDSTTGRKLRVSNLHLWVDIPNSSINVRLYNIWNGDSAAEESISKNQTGASFALNSIGTELLIRGAAITGDPLVVLAAIIETEHTSSFSYHSMSANVSGFDIKVRFWGTNGDSALH